MKKYILIMWRRGVSNFGALTSYCSCWFGASSNR